MEKKFGWFFAYHHGGLKECLDTESFVSDLKYVSSVIRFYKFYFYDARIGCYRFILKICLILYCLLGCIFILKCNDLMLMNWFFRGRFDRGSFFQKRFPFFLQFWHLRKQTDLSGFLWQGRACPAVEGVIVADFPVCCP